MATIESLNKSITLMDDEELISFLLKIRNNRLRKPERKARVASAPAKTKRKPSAKAPKQQDLFAIANSMNEEQKASLLAKLLTSRTK